MWLAAVVAGLGALGWLYSKAAKAVRAGVEWGRAWSARFDALDHLVTHELTPNSGSSIKDAVGRLEARQEAMEVRQEEHVQLSAGAQEAIEARLDNVEAVSKTYAEAQGHLWPAIEAVAKAVPPGVHGHQPEADI